MHDETRNEIARVLESCLQEAHPLRRGSPILLEIGRLGPSFERLNNEEIGSFVLPRIDQVLEHVKTCFCCTAKGLALAVILCQNRRGLGKCRHERFVAHLARRPPGDHRDYRAEVEAVLRR